MRIPRKFEPLGSVRFYLMALPDAIDCGFAHPLGFSHSPAAPVSCPRGLGLERRLYNLFNSFYTEGRLTSPSLSHFPQAIGSLINKAFAPQGNSLHIEIQV